MLLFCAPRCTLALPELVAAWEGCAPRCSAGFSVPPCGGVGGNGGGVCAIRDRISRIITAPLRRREDPLDQDCSESSPDFEVLMNDRFEAQETDLVCEGIVHMHGLIYVNTPTCASDGLGTVG